MDESKVKVRAMRFKNEVSEKIEVLAKEQNRSVNNFVETVLLKYFEDYEKENEIIA